MMNHDDPLHKIATSLTKIADLLQQKTGQNASKATPIGQDADLHDLTIPAYVWHGQTYQLEALTQINGAGLNLLVGIDGQAEKLIANSTQFMQAKGANNALLWGARGTGKSSLVKAVHHHLWPKSKGRLVLVEIARADLPTLPQLLARLKSCPQRQFILFCDDLSFENDDQGYKNLKAVLEGGLSGRPQNVILYATSNRRHLISRQMVENEAQKAIMPSEAVEEKLSLSDRFGLWLGFHNIDQDHYLAMVKTYAAYYKIPASGDELGPQALAWATTRGARSGRVASQYIADLAGHYGIAIDPTLPLPPN